MKLNIKKWFLKHEDDHKKNKMKKYYELPEFNNTVKHIESIVEDCQKRDIGVTPKGIIRLVYTIIEHYNEN